MPDAGGKTEGRSWGMRIAVGASLLLFVAIVGQDWYRLGPYEPSGWDASDYLKLAAICAILVAVLGALVFLGIFERRVVVPAVRLLATVALAAVAYRIAFTPDFGFGFARVDIDVERLAGAWLGLGAAAVGSAAAWLTR